MSLMPLVGSLDISKIYIAITPRHEYFLYHLSYLNISYIYKLS
jgi:hypothetical protein